MSDSNIQDLRVFYDCENFEDIWQRIATDIKIRKSDHLDDIPEFRGLPNKLQNEIKKEMNAIHNGYKVFSNEGYFHNSHVLLFTNEKGRWIAIFQDRPSVNIRALLISIGIGIGGIIFIWNVLENGNSIVEQKHDNDLELTTHNSSESVNTVDNIVSNIWSNISGVALIIMSPFLAFYAFQKWFSTGDSKHNKLVEACMLKKLEGISSSQ